MRNGEAEDLLERLRTLESERCGLEPDELDQAHGEGELRSLRRSYEERQAERWAQPHPHGRDLATRSSPW